MSTSSAPPRVSVVIAAYNAGDYLIEAVKSVLGQTVHDLELIVVDDGSTDGSADALSGIDDPRLRVVRQENAGQTRAKNRGIEESCGEIIGFCDADDYWYPNKLELQLPLFDRSEKTGVVYSAAQKIDEHGVPIESTWATPHRGQVVNSLFMRNFVPFGTALVRRTCIEQVGPFNESFRMGIDWDLWLRVSTRFEFDFVEDYTYAYRIWSGQMSSNWRGRYDCAFRIMREFVDANPGYVSADLYRKARANTFANKARARTADTPVAAFGDTARALVLDPFTAFNWKTLARLPVLAAESRLSVRSKTDVKSERFGLTKRIASPLVRRITRNQPRIFMYHRFGGVGVQNRLGIDDFRAQVEYLSKSCIVLPLNEAIALDHTKTLGKPVVVLTIDDGYIDVIQHAHPILHDFKLRATIFVTSGFVERESYLWPDKIRACLDGIPNGTYKLRGRWNGQKLKLVNTSDRERAWHCLADKLLYKSDSSREEHIQDLFQSVGIDAGRLDMSEFNAMDWNDLATLANEGFEIGDHTWHHSHLPSLGDNELVAELRNSKSYIENKLGISVTSFAYPNGTMNDFDSRVVSAVSEAGYQQAVMSVPYRVQPPNCFALPRLSGEINIQRFVNQVSGYELLRSPRVSIAGSSDNVQ